MIKINRLYYLIIASIILILLDRMEMFSVIHKLSLKVIFPLKSNIYNMTLFTKNFHKAVLMYPEMVKVIEEKEKLKKEKEEIKFSNMRLTEENLKLRQQLEAPLPANFKFIPAQVISVSRKMELAVGEKEGVKVGMVAIDGVSLIGVVDFVQNGRSTVMTLVDSDSEVSVKTSRGGKGIAVGQGGEMVVLTKVLQKDPLFLEDTVFTSGEKDIPPNLWVGKVSHINSEDVSVYKQAKLETPVDFHSLKTVFIVSW